MKVWAPRGIPLFSLTALPPYRLTALPPYRYTRCAISGAAAATRVCRLNVEP
jgi:hypothetical protein